MGNLCHPRAPLRHFALLSLPPNVNLGPEQLLVVISQTGEMEREITTVSQVAGSNPRKILARPVTDTYTQNIHWQAQR